MGNNLTKQADRAVHVYVDSVCRFRHARMFSSTGWTVASSFAGTGAVAGAAGGPAGAMAAINAAGFTSSGVAAGSMAAAVQTPVTTAGSTFAALQSAGATGVLGAAATTGAVLAGAVAGASILGGIGWGFHEASFQISFRKMVEGHVQNLFLVHDALRTRVGNPQSSTDTISE